MARIIKVELTVLQAECLLELAQEAEIEALRGRSQDAAEIAMDHLIRALSRRGSGSRTT